MLHIGTVGTNFITSQMLGAVAMTEGVECAVVSSRKRETAQAFADKHNIKDIAISLNELLDHKDIDTVYLASPNNLHVSQCLESVAAGKNVICEKPLAISEKEAQSVFEAARKKGVFVFEAISTLFMPDYQELRRTLPSLGNINSLNCRYTQRSSRLDAFMNGEHINVFDPAMQGGVLNDLGVYAVHAIVGLFGSPASVSYSPVLAKNGVDLAGSLFMRYPGFTARVFCAKDRDAGSGFIVDGECGSVIQSGPINSFINCELHSAEGAKPFSAHKNAIADEKRLSYELAAFRDAIQNHDIAFFDSMAEQSITTARVLELAHASANEDNAR